MADIQCQLEIPKEKGEDTAALTVGKVFVLNCEGPWPESFKADAAELRLDKENQYKLKLLSLQFESPTQAKLLVTSYKTGEHHLKAVQIVDADHSVVLGDFSFAVNSVMNPQEPAKEPLGPVGPLGLSLPIWYPLSILAAVLALVFLVGFRWYLRRQKRKLLEQMRLSEYVQEPLFQFYQTARRLQRGFGFFSGQPLQPDEASQFVKEIDQAYKIYLARKFQVPTFAWKERRILSDLRQNFPEFYQVFRLEIRKALAELSRAMKAGGTMNEKDCQQLFELLRKQVDQIESWQKSKGGER